MIRRLPVFPVFVIATLGALLSSTGARAQLNEKRVERDATGVYNGKIKGGQLYFYSPGQPVSGPYTPGGGSGKMRVPVKDGVANTVLKDSELPGNDRAPCNGRWQRSDVRRLGKLIAMKGTGSANPDDTEHSKWSNGKLTGNLTDKGPKWFASGKLSAQYVVPDTYTQKLSGMHVTGKG